MKIIEIHEKIRFGGRNCTIGGGTPCTKRLGDPLEYDFGTFGGSICTLYIVLGGGTPPPLIQGACFVPGAIYSFLAISGSCHVCTLPIYCFDQWPRLLLPIRVGNDSVPICFCAVFACIHPLGFQSSSYRFPTPVQPFVFDLWPLPGFKIQMEKPYRGKT